MTPLMIHGFDDRGADAGIHCMSGFIEPATSGGSLSSVMPFLQVALLAG